MSCKWQWKEIEKERDIKRNFAHPMVVIMDAIDVQISYF
jgi:hypothetical protein